MSETLTTAEVAERLGTDAKTLRKFFRSNACDIEPVGQGRRYVLTAKQTDKLKPKFDTWASKPTRETKPASEGSKSAPAAKAPTKRASKTRSKQAEVIEEEDDLDLDLDEDEPTDEDLDDLEDLEDLEL